MTEEAAARDVPTVLTTPRLTLRSPTFDDVEPLMEAYTESAKSLRRWMAWYHDGYTAEECRQWLETVEGERQRGEAYHFALIDETGRLLSVIGLHHIDRLNDTGEVGYWIRDRAVGHGYATEAVRRLLTFCFADVGLHRVELLIAERNVRSLAVASRLGCHHEATLRQRLAIRGGGYRNAELFVAFADDARDEAPARDARR